MIYMEKHIHNNNWATMETTIERNSKEWNIYTVTIGNHIVHTTWARLCDTQVVTQWVTEANKAHSKNRNKNQKDLIVGLVGENSKNYANGNDYFGYGYEKQPKDALQILNICIGSNCLVCEVPHGTIYYEAMPKALRDMFNSNRTVVVGVGVDRTVELMGLFGVKVARAVELRRLCGSGSGGGGGVERLAKAVLGEEWVVERPKRMVWWLEKYDYLSNEKVMFGTVDAFFVYRMGVKLLEK